MLTARWIHTIGTANNLNFYGLNVSCQSLIFDIARATAVARTAASNGDRRLPKIDQAGILKVLDEADFQIRKRVDSPEVYVCDSFTFVSNATAAHSRFHLCSEP